MSTDYKPTLKTGELTIVEGLSRELKYVPADPLESEKKKRKAKL